MNAEYLFSCSSSQYQCERASPPHILGETYRFKKTMMMNNRMCGPASICQRWIALSWRAGHIHEWGSHEEES